MLLRKLTRFWTSLRGRKRKRFWFGWARPTNKYSRICTTMPPTFSAMRWLPPSLGSQSPFGLWKSGSMRKWSGSTNSWCPQLSLPKTKQRRWRISSLTLLENSEPRYFCWYLGRRNDEDNRLQNRVHKKVYKNDAKVALKLGTETGVFGESKGGVRTTFWKNIGDFFKIQHYRYFEKQRYRL